MSKFRAFVSFAAVSAPLLLGAPGASAATCVNRFLAHSEGPKQVVTLLTGKLTFQEAQALVESIRKNEAPPVEWVDDKGKTISKQFGDLKVVRPMPVGCDGKSSGVVLIVAFPGARVPSGKMMIKLDAAAEAVAFEEQKQ